MELEKQVCSLELAKRLKELGVKQESYFLWVEFLEERGNEWRISDNPEMRKSGGMWKWCPAFTVAELGEMLPQALKAMDDSTVWLTCNRSTGDKWCVWYHDAADNRMEHKDYAATEAAARAKMLIYLLENKLITV